MREREVREGEEEGQIDRPRQAGRHTERKRERERERESKSQLSNSNVPLSDLGLSSQQGHNLCTQGHSDVRVERSA